MKVKFSHKWLKRNRLENGYTQQEMAFKLCVSRVTYQNIEYGKIQPSLENFIRLHSIFKTSFQIYNGKIIRYR